MAEGVAERAHVARPARTARPSLPGAGPPRVGPAEIVRPRLVRHLARVVEHRLTVVRAPAGSGKSVLLGQWARKLASSGWPVVWASPRTRPGAPPAPVDGDRPTVVLLDGLDPPSVAEVEDWLSHAPAVRLVVGVRTAFALPLSRWRLAGQLLELDGDDLAMTAVEVGQVFDRCGQVLGDVQAQTILARTRGWPALVSLAALTAGRDPEAAWSDYLRSEVYGPLSPAVKDFLLRTSVADPICAPLAGVLSGRVDAFGLLDQLRLAGLVDADSTMDHSVKVERADPRWWRLIRPFGDFLRREAEVALGAQLSELRQYAVRWLADGGYTATALRLAASAAERPALADVIVRAAGTLLLDRHDLSGARDVLSTVEALDDPTAAAALAVAAAARGDLPGVAALASLAREHCDAAPTVRARAAQTAADVARLVLARTHQRLDVLADAADRVLTQLDRLPPDLFDDTARLRSVAQEGQALVALWHGGLDDATALSSAVTTRADATGSAAAVGLAWIDAVRGFPTRAAERARSARATVPEWAGGALDLCTLIIGLDDRLRGIEPADDAARMTVPSGGAGQAGLVLAATRARWFAWAGDVASARYALPALDSGTDVGPVARAWLALAEAEVHLAAGRPVHALTALSQSSYQRDTALAGPTRVMAARAYLASAAPARARSLVAPVLEWPEVGPWVGVEVWLVDALAADSLGHDGSVGVALARAIGAAAPDGLVRPFLAPDVRSLLDRHRDLLGAHPALTARLDPVRVSAADRLPEPITARESVVLRYLPTLLTLNDIAEELSVSPNTVKSHLRHLYRKLGAGNRRDAVRRARRAGLLWDN